MFAVSCSKPEWTRSPVKTRARARKENHDPGSESANLVEEYNGLARLGNRNGARAAARLAPRDTNISHSAIRLPPELRKATARRRLMDVADQSRLQRLVPYVLAPPHPPGPPPRMQAARSVAAP